MFEAIQTALQSNQLFAGGIVLGAFGMAGAFAGRLGQSLLQGLTARLFPSITLDHRSPLYGYVQAWLQDHPYTHSCRSLTVMRRESPENGEVRLVPGDGSHLLRHRRGWIWLQRSRDTARSSRSGDERETLQIHVLALRRQVLTDLIGDIMASHGPRADTLALYGASAYGDWNELGRIGHRRLDSVIVAGRLGSMLLEDARRFLHAKAWYADRGVPWRRGYTLLIMLVPATKPS
ncbi:MAG TPA: hypothetical protein VM661_07515 [Candidatus Sulfotelmatobacter sp.]|jgi:chaperone BCS1|nr:hypothetical protein [Candidatus Sulfotelmatobacter sp.]